MIESMHPSDTNASQICGIITKVMEIGYFFVNIGIISSFLLQTHGFWEISIERGSFVGMVSLYSLHELAKRKTPLTK